MKTLSLRLIIVLLLFSTLSFPHNASAAVGSYINSFDTAGSGNTRPMSATWDGTYYWVIDFTTDEVYQYNSSGTYTGVHFDTLGTGTNPYGIVWDGTYFWVTDRSNAEVYRYNANGTYSSFSFDTAASGNAGISGITWDGTYFWTTDAADTEIYRYNANGTYSSYSFDTAGSGAAAPHGIAWDGTNFWVFDQFDNEVYRYNANGTYASFSFDTAAAGTGQSYGIAWDGTNLLVSDFADAEVYRFEGPVYTTAPTVTTNSASAPSPTAATLFGSITDNGGADATQHGFAYGTASNLSTVIATTTLGGFSGAGSFSSAIGSLSENTTYYFRAYATNSAGTGYGSILSFTAGNSTPSRSLRLFEGMTVKFTSGKMILYQQ